MWYRGILNKDVYGGIVDKIPRRSKVKKKNNMRIGIKLDWVVNHPHKGPASFDKGVPSYPSENEPNGIDPINTSFNIKEFQIDRVQQSTLLQSDHCEVRSVITAHIMGSDSNFPVRVGSDKGMDILCDGKRFYISPTAEV